MPLPSLRWIAVACALSLRAVTLAPGAWAAGAGPEAVSASGYRFLLDGYEESPRILSLAGTPGRPAPGDLAIVDGGAPLRLGAPGTYDLVRVRDKLNDTTTGYKRRGEPDLLIAVIDFTFDGSKKVILDPLADMPPAARRKLRGVSIDTRAPDAVRLLKDVPPGESCVRLSSGARTAKGDMPTLPASLECLVIYENSSYEPIGLKPLAGLPSLRVLDWSGMSQEAFDAGLVKGAKDLRFLRLEAGKVKNAAALGTLSHLRELEMDVLDGVGRDLDLKSFPQLRRLTASFTDLARVIDVSAPRQLESLDLRGSKKLAAVEIGKGTPGALDELILVGTGIGTEAAKKLEKALPKTRVSYGWQQSLRLAWAAAQPDEIVLGPVTDEDSGEQSTLVSIKGRDLSGLLAAIELSETKSGEPCLCAPDPEIELRKNGRTMMRLAFWNGVFFRWSDGPWPGDGWLTRASPEKIRQWFTANGYDGFAKRFSQGVEAEAEQDESAGDFIDKLKAYWKEHGATW
jgi:hypothetical protein